MSQGECIKDALTRELMSHADNVRYEAGVILLSHMPATSQATLAQEFLRPQTTVERRGTLLWRLATRPNRCQVSLYRQHLYDEDLLVRSIATYGVYAAGTPEEAIPLLNESARRGTEVQALYGPHGPQVHSSHTAVYYLGKYGRRTRGLLLELLHDDVYPAVTREILHTLLDWGDPAALQYCLVKLSEPVPDDGVWREYVETVFRFGQNAEKRALLESTPLLTPSRRRFMADLARASGDEYAFDLCIIATEDDRLAQDVSALWRNDPSFFGRLINKRFGLSSYEFFDFEAFKEWYRSMLKEAGVDHGGSTEKRHGD